MGPGKCEGDGGTLRAGTAQSPEWSPNLRQGRAEDGLKDAAAAPFRPLNCYLGAKMCLDGAGAQT